MLLRSSSTPILSSLGDSHHQSSYSLDRAPSLPSSASPEGAAPKHISFPSPRTPNHHTAPFLNRCSYTASPDRDSPSHAGFRRVRSEGNLERLPHLYGDVRFPPRVPAAAPPLETIPSSLAVYSDAGRGDAQDPGAEGDENELLLAAGAAAATVAADGAYSPERTVMMADSVAICGGSADGCCSVFEGETGAAALPPLYLARGLGIDSGLFGPADGAGGKGGGGGGPYRLATGNGGDRSADLESFYKKMVEENPSDALFLRNYAEFLYQAKGDPRGAEYYYSRAILAEPGDGEVLSQYAKLVWELHRDQERASGYFERAVQAAPHDSGVLAAYANFLWETDGEKDGDDNRGGGGGGGDGWGGGGPGAVGGGRYPQKGEQSFPWNAAVASATA